MSSWGPSDPRHESLFLRTRALRVPCSFTRKVPLCAAIYPICPSDGASHYYLNGTALQVHKPSRCLPPLTLCADVDSTTKATTLVQCYEGKSTPLLVLQLSLDLATLRSH